MKPDHIFKPKHGSGIRCQIIPDEAHRAFCEEFTERVRPLLEECDKRAREATRAFYSRGMLN